MKILHVLILVLASTTVFSQTDDEKIIAAIYDEALSNGQSWPMLTYLTKQIGHRLSGSPQAAAAVEWSRQEMMRQNFSRVFLQEVMVPHWVRGEVEVAKVVGSTSYGSVPLRVTALGNSEGTGLGGISAPVLRVESLEEVEKLGREKVEGKIVYYARPMDPTLISTFQAYSGAVDQRGGGASIAAKYGAIGVLVRSMASNTDDFPHTGSLRYDPNQPKIPAMAVSTRDADQLDLIIEKDGNVVIYMENHATMLDDVLSHNVVGELAGKKKNSYIAVGGHLDSWDKGEGAHDDGGGCVQAIEALRILKAIGYTPNNTLRSVMWMNEENGLRGGLEYARLAAENKEKHVAAIESDRGAFIPRGFTSTVDAQDRKKWDTWKELLKPYGLHDFDSPGGGADISPLADQGVALFGLLPDSQRYFNVHHSSADVLETVDPRELAMGAAAMAAWIYLIDTYGL